MNYKYLKLIPFANAFMVLTIMIHIYFIDINIELLIIGTIAYNVVVGMIVHKYKGMYRDIELSISKFLFIVITFLGISAMIVMVLLFQNFDIMSILIGLWVGLIIHLIQILICLK